MLVGLTWRCDVVSGLPSYLGMRLSRVSERHLAVDGAISLVIGSLPSVALAQVL